MSVETFANEAEPDDLKAPIWRFLQLWKFKDLLTTSELYFRRADLFLDEFEGIPPEQSVAKVMGLNPYDIRDRLELNNSIGSDAQFREGFYVNSWYLFGGETLKMWMEYAKEGVAVCSRYDLLKESLGSDSARYFLGLVRYGSEHFRRMNIIDFITTKRSTYAEEREVRAIAWLPDEHAGINRHFDSNNIPHDRPLTKVPTHVPDHHRCKIDLGRLVTGIIVNPFASDTAVCEIETLTKNAVPNVTVQPSELTSYRHLLPDRLIY